MKKATIVNLTDSTEVINYIVLVKRTFSTKEKTATEFHFTDYENARNKYSEEVVNITKFLDICDGDAQISLIATYKEFKPEIKLNFSMKQNGSAIQKVVNKKLAELAN